MGTVVNSEEDGEKFRIARPRSSSSSVPKPSSARTEPSTARVTSRNRIGFSRTPEELARSISAARNRCCRFIRPRSLAPSRCRARTYCSAWPPLRTWVPGARSRPVYESFSGVGVQTWTPPRTSTVFMKLVKSTSR